MRYWLHRLFDPPSFSDNQDNTQAAAILNAIGWSLIFVLALILAIRSLQGSDANLTEVNLILLVMIASTAITLFILRRGYVRTASLIIVSVGWIGLSYVAWVADGIRDVAFFAYIIPILMAGLLLGWQTSAIFIILSILSGWSLAYAEANQLFFPTLDEPLNFARDMTAILSLAAVLIYLTINNLRSALNRSRSTAHELSVSNRSQEELRVELEQRVEARTSELQKRAAQLEAVSTVARTIASVQDIGELLPDITELVSQHFGFYHVGIFLLDETNKQAVLRASNSGGGKRMLAGHHALPVDLTSIVGYATSRAEPRIVLDVGTDSIFFDNPNLPETRSELALPLRVAGRVIGALDVQSTEVNAFRQEDIAVLTTLADQVAIAIENSRLFSEARRALDESKATFEKYAQQEWGTFVHQSKHMGYIFDGKNVAPLERSINRDHIKRAIQTGRLSLEKASATITIPIKLRGQTIGILDVRSKKGQREWKQDEISLLEAAAERAALALENARLVESAQRRAARERAIGDISAKIGTGSNLETILQTAVEELGRKMGGATEVTLEIGNDGAPSSR